MKLRIRTWTAETHVDVKEIEVPDDAVAVEVDVMSDARVKFIVDKNIKEEKKA